MCLQGITNIFYVFGQCWPKMIFQIPANHKIFYISRSWKIIEYLGRYYTCGRLFTISTPNGLSATFEIILIF